MTHVMLDRRERDGLCDGLGVCLQSDDLAFAARESDAERVKRTLGTFETCVRILDQIGWGKCGEQDSYELAVDSELARLASGLTEEVEGYVRDCERGFNVYGDGTSALPEAQATLAALLKVAGTGVAEAVA